MEGLALPLVGLFLASLAMRMQLVGIGPLLPAIQADLTLLPPNRLRALDSLNGEGI